MDVAGEGGEHGGHEGWAEGGASFSASSLIPYLPSAHCVQPAPVGEEGARIQATKAC